MQQYFIQAELIINKPVDLPKAVTHHLYVVLNRKKNQYIRLVNPLGVGFVCIVNDQANQATPIAKIDFIADSKVDLTIALAFIKKERFEWAIEKCAEVGVKTLIPIISMHSQSALYKQDWPKKKERLNKIALEASEQNYRQFPLIVNDYITFDQLATIKSQRNFITTPTGIPPSVLLKQQPYQSATICIGPEGGFSEEELEFALNQGYQALALGHRIYRSETAAIAAAILVGSAYE